MRQGLKSLRMWTLVAGNGPNTSINKGSKYPILGGEGGRENAHINWGFYYLKNLIQESARFDILVYAIYKLPELYSVQYE